MRDDPAFDLIDSLSTDLVRVRRIPPLSVAVAAVAGAGAVLTGAVLSMHNAQLDRVLHDTSALLVLLGLLAVAAGGCVAGLASAIPGRDRAGLVGCGIALAGLTLALGAGFASAAWGTPLPVRPPGAEVRCMSWGLAFGLVPLALGFVLVSRGFSPRPPVTVGLTLLGTSAIGALIVQLTCAIGDARHVLVGHSATPLLLGGIGLAIAMLVARRPAR